MTSEKIISRNSLQSTFPIPLNYFQMESVKSEKLSHNRCMKKCEKSHLRKVSCEEILRRSIKTRQKNNASKQNSRNNSYSPNSLDFNHMDSQILSPIKKKKPSLDYVNFDKLIKQDNSPSLNYCMDCYFILITQQDIKSSTINNTMKSKRALSKFFINGTDAQKKLQDKIIEINKQVSSPKIVKANFTLKGYNDKSEQNYLSSNRLKNSLSCQQSFNNIQSEQQTLGSSKSNRSINPKFFLRLMGSGPKFEQV